MELHEKLQALRKQKGLTQEELAAQLYVSRTAISGFFSISVDELLSGDELLTFAQQEQHQTHSRFRDQVFGLLDCVAGLMLFLPFFGQPTADAAQAVCLFSLTSTCTHRNSPFQWERAAF